MTLIKNRRRTRAVLVAAPLFGWPLLASPAAAQSGGIANQGAPPETPLQKKQFRAALYEALPWLPQGKRLDEAQEEVFGMLQKKAGREVALPSLPNSNLIRWQFARYYPGGEADVDKTEEPKKLSPQKRQHLYALMTEDLLVARQLLQDKKPERQRIGLQLADSVKGKLVALVDDKPLELRVTESFILPYLSVAPPEHFKSLGRPGLLKMACGTYMVSGETAKARDALKAFIPIATQAGSHSEVAWARIKLANLLAKSGDYAEAIAQLKAVPDTSSLSPIRDKLLPQYENKQKEQAKNAKPKNAGETNNAQ